MTMDMLSSIFAHLLSLKYPANPPRRLPTIQEIRVVEISNPAVQGREVIIS